MRIFRRSNYEPIPKGENDYVLAFDGRNRDVFMPSILAEIVAGWNRIVPSPTGSRSYYDTTEKTWTHTPEGSHRVSNHWNWSDKRNPGKMSCPTDVPVPKGIWAVAIWETDRYRVIEMAPNLGPGARRSVIRLTDTYLVKDPEYRDLFKLRAEFVEQQRIAEMLRRREHILAMVETIHDLSKTGSYEEFTQQYFQTSREITALSVRERNKIRKLLPNRVINPFSRLDDVPVEE